MPGRKRKADVLVEKSEKSSTRQDIVSPEKEIRPARFRSGPNADISARISRAATQKLYLIQQEDIIGGEGIGRSYAVLGSTGNVYNVTLNSLPSCTCPDSLRGHLCKHVLFIMIKVLRVPMDSNILYQKGLLQSELRSIFDNAPTTTTAGVVAKKSVINAFKQPNSRSSAEEPKVEDQNIDVELGECAICFDSMDNKSQLDKCATCKNYLHKDCLQKWLANSSTCCYCRSPWPKSKTGKVRSEGYLNLGDIQGMSRTRDTTTYYRWFDDNDDDE